MKNNYDVGYNTSFTSRNNIGGAIAFFVCVLLALSAALAYVIFFVKDVEKVEEIENNVTVVVFEEPETEYARALLSDEEKAIYDSIVESVDNMQNIEGLEYTGEIDRLFEIVNYVMLDKPEFFWFNGNGLSSSYITVDEETNLKSVTIWINYLLTEDERFITEQTLEETVAQIKADVASMNDFDKSKYVYDFLANNITYDLAYKDNGMTLYDAVAFGRDVCAGYCRYAQYIFENIGIECIPVIGMGENESHAWNIIKLDGEYYLFDATWGDQDGADDFVAYINYAYLNFDDAAGIASAHVPDETIPLPECNATADNYYIHEGLRFTELNKEAIAEKFRASVDSGVCTISFANEELRDTAVQWLVDGFGIFNIVGEREYTYTLSDTMNNLIVIFS